MKFYRVLNRWLIYSVQVLCNTLTIRYVTMTSSDINICRKEDVMYTHHSSLVIFMYKIIYLHLFHLLLEKVVISGVLMMSLTLPLADLLLST